MIAAIEWGSVPDWVAAVGTVASLAGAVRLLWLQARERRQSEAVAVTAWPNIQRHELSGDLVLRSIVTSNTGPGPVFDVVARVMWRGHCIAFSAPDVLEPGRHEWSNPMPGWSGWDMTAALASGATPRVDLLFRDGANRAWHRDEHGGIREYPAYDWSERSQQARQQVERFHRDRTA